MRKIAEVIVLTKAEKEEFYGFAKKLGQQGREDAGREAPGRSRGMPEDSGGRVEYQMITIEEAKNAVMRITAGWILTTHFRLPITTIPSIWDFAACA